MSRAPYAKNIRHGAFNRLRYSNTFLAWLKVQATRLSGPTVGIYTRMVNGDSEGQIRALTGSFPGNTVAPVASGVTTQGSTLTTTNGTWTGSPAPTFSYRWNRNGSPIAGATAQTYVLAAADVGSTISSTVIGTNTLGSVGATSASLGPIT